MNNRKLAVLLSAVITSIVFLFSACKKINEATELGGGLIPVVDNINTFDTIIEVETFNDIFTLPGDSLRADYLKTHWLGLINNDPIFGRTDARIFLELKPPRSSFPYVLSSRVPPYGDSLIIDSAVMVLSYVETYGDTNAAQTISVFEVDPISDFRSDSGYFLNRNSFTYNNLLGSRSVIPARLKDSVKVYLDTTKNQLRIPLNASFVNRLSTWDTTAAGINNLFRNDSVFNSKFQGFAVQSTGGNALMGFDLTNSATKLAIYYRNRKPNVAKYDTLVSYFPFNTASSANANYVQRNYGGTQVLATAGGGADNILYIQNSPGTFATIKVPGFGSLNNRVVHRAELIMEQVYDVSDSLFPAPDVLYLDAFDPTISKFRTIPYDLIATQDASGQISFNLANFGYLPFRVLDPANRVVKTWKFDISRYVQHVLTQTAPAYDLRVSSPTTIFPQYGTPGANNDVTTRLELNPSFAKGRIRLHGGDPTKTNPRRMRIRLIYSKI